MSVAIRAAHLASLRLWAAITGAATAARAAVAGAAVGPIVAVGQATRLAGSIGVGALSGRCDRRELARAMWRYGVQSLPVVSASAGFAGIIMVLQVAVWVRRFGAQELVGWFAAFTSLRELVPVLVGLMFSGRVGASHTSELATWRASARFDVLAVLGIDVMAWLLVPRLVAMVLAMMALTALGDVVALALGALGAKAMLGVGLVQFYRSMTAHLTPASFWFGLTKSAAFGGLIAVIATHCGLRQRGGARGVGRAVYTQVVASALAIFGLDWVVTACVR